MTARATSGLAYDDYLYLTGESPNIDEKIQASVVLDYVISRVRTDTNSGLAKVVTGNYTSENPFYDLKSDVDNLTAVGGTASVTDYIAIEQGAGTKKLLVGDLPFASSASSVASITGGDGITASSATGAVTLSADLKANGGVVIESAELAIDLAASSITGTLADGDIASAATWNAKQAALTFGIADTNSVVIDSASVADNDYAKFTASGLEGRTASETKTDLSLNNVENIALSTWAGSTNVTTLGTVATGTWDATAVGVTKGGTGLTTVAKGSVLAVNTADTISAVAGVTNGHVLTYDSTADTVGWASAGHIASIEGEGTTTTGVLSTGETGTTKFLRTDGDDSNSWQVPPDTNTTYTAGDGLDLSVGDEFSVDLMANGGLEITTTELSVAAGISQYDVAQFTTGVVDDDFLRIDGTAVEGRSASEVKTDIGLGNVENTALSTWAGSTNITTLGTIATGTWEGTTVALDQGGTGMTSIAKGSVLVANAANTLSAASGVTDGHVLTYTSASDTVGWGAVPSSGDPAGTAVAMAIALGG